MNKKILTVTLIITAMTLNTWADSKSPKRKKGKGKLQNINYQPHPPYPHFRDRRFKDKERYPHQHQGQCFGDIDRFRGELKLSDNQIEQVKETNLTYQVKLLEHKEKIAPLKIKLKRLLLNKDIKNKDLKEIRSLLEKIGKHKINLRMLKIKQKIEVENILKSKDKNFKAEDGKIERDKSLQENQ
jgi:hypothetical protein